MGSSNSLAHLQVLLAQFLYAFTILSTQEILNHGVQNLVLGCYCLSLSALILATLAFFSPRDVSINLSLKVLGWVLLFGLLIFIIQIFGLVGIQLTSPGFATAMQPLASIFTAISSVILGVEKVMIRRYDGKVKVAGVLICVVGAIVMTVYRGPCIICSGSISPPNLHVSSSTLLFQLGALCTIISNMTSGVLGALCARVLTKYNPSPAPLLAVMFAIGAGLSGSLALLNCDKSDWMLHGQLIPALVILNVLALSIFPVLLLKAVVNLGPTMVSCYQPVCTIVSSCLSVVFFGSTIYLGSVIGAVILVLGLLCVTWAQEQFTKLSIIEQVF